MKLKNYLFVIGIALMALSMASCGGKSSGDGQGQDSVPKYELQTLKPVDTEVTYKFPAVLKGGNDVEIFPQVQGRITGIFYENGQLVKQGQRLFTIESSEQQMQATTCAASVKSAMAVVNSAKLKLDSQKKLYDKKIVSEFVYRTAQDEYSTALAQLAQAKAQLSIAQTELSRCTVVSPITGVVTGRDFNIGALVGPSMQSPLTTVSSQSVIKAQFSIPENLFAHVIKNNNLVSTAQGFRSSKGNTLEDYVTFNLVTSTGEKYDQKGKFRSMSGMIDSQTGTATCYVDFKNPHGLLHSGNSATIEIPMTANDVFIVPQSACKELQDKYVLYKVDENGLAESVIVNVTPTDDGKNYILESKKLKEGDQILMTGVARVADGMRLK